MKNKKGLGKKFVIILIVIIFVAGFWTFIFFKKDKIAGYVINENKRPEPVDTLTVPLDNTDEQGNPLQITEEELEKELKETEEYQSFASSCASSGGGVLVSIDSGSATYECYIKADDAGSNCRTDADCGSYNCNLQAGVDSGVCILVKTDKNVSDMTYIYTYNCTSAKPGICGEIPRDVPIYSWVGDTVIEAGKKFAPGDEGVFKPI